MSDRSNGTSGSDRRGDPFDALRRPDAPIAPRPAFARELRSRLTDALRPVLGTAPDVADTTPTPRRAIAMSVTPYFNVRNCAAALDFYRDAFGAVEVMRLVGDDGRIGHAEITIGGSHLMLADEYPEVDALGPESRGGPSCSFDIDLGDPALLDGVYGTALRLGATSVREPEDHFYGRRNAIVQDPFGHRWTIGAAIEQLTDEQLAERAKVDEGFGSYTVQTGDGALAASVHGGAGAAAGSATGEGHQVKPHGEGDLYYFTLRIADLPRAQRFFGAVLGWQFAGESSGHIENISAPPGGLNDKGGAGSPQLWFVVDDIHAAVERVRAAGGTAADPVHYESGWSADCVDDQGTEFCLSVPSPAYTA